MTYVERPRITPLLPLDPNDTRPPRIMHRTALLLGGKTQLARLCLVKAGTVSAWFKRGYGIDQVCKVYFALGEHIKELEQNRREIEIALLKAMRKRNYRFPPDGVYIKDSQGKVT